VKITRVAATPLNVPVEIDAGGLVKKTSFSCCLVEIEAGVGRVGHGFTAITEEEVVAAAVNEVAAPALVGADPMAHEALWEKLYWLLSPRGQTGYASHTIAALDVALWDLKGQVLGLPLWRLLGGARSRVPVYTTFGFNAYDRVELAAAARHWVAQGHTRLKMTVGHHGLARRDEPRPLDALIAEDVERVRAVREAIGPGIPLYVDANCSLDALHAGELAQRLEPYGIAFFEEPITQNDVRQMADLRRRTRIPLACGQNEGLAYRFRDLMLGQAVDVVQPNVVISGGFTQCLRIAGMAQAFNVALENGGAWPFHNMHLHGGLAAGGLVEYHLPAVAVCEAVYGPLPEPQNGWLELPEAPGLGFAPDPARVRELRRHGTSHGKGKA
jgi:L-alanine-DL-glutamate epimerase-like enolase superfamily enzyme